MIKYEYYNKYRNTNPKGDLYMLYHKDNTNSNFLRELYIEIDNNKLITFISENCYTILGYAVEELIDKPISNYISPIPIFMMSTGQRSAVVLSIFIRLHIIMKSAPNFILLDEPVANIDDLNILALLDFLKEICSSNKTQIFFTTANEGVSRLFKRKFSFLEDRFCEFEFVRYGNENTIISKKIYNSNNDAVVNNLELLGKKNS